MRNIIFMNKTLLTRILTIAEYSVVKVFTFDELVEYGKSQEGANIVDGMPWSFSIDDLPVTHENNELYLVGMLPNQARFGKNDVLLVTEVTDVAKSLGVKQECQAVPKEIFNLFFK